MAFMEQNRYLALALFFTILAVLGSKVMSQSLQEEEVELSKRHEQWMEKHGILYNAAAEKEKRFQIFKDNVAYIKSFNAAASENTTFKLSINQFADQTHDEFKDSLKGLKVKRRTTTSTSMFKYNKKVVDIPPSRDWRKLGAVTPVRYQGNHCGSCWAFSAVAAIEGLHQITTGNLVSLSEQELISCVTTNQGCSGGAPEYAYIYVKENGGMTTEANYPYSGIDEVCNIAKRKSSFQTVQIDSYCQVPSNSEKALLIAVSKLPVSVGIDPSTEEFRFYSSGIFNGKCGTNPDHSVTAVGYGTNSDGTKYWLVKNSWGSKWGEEGYIRIKRDVDEKEGQCGIAMYGSFPSIGNCVNLEDGINLLPNTSGQEIRSYSSMCLLCQFISFMFVFIVFYF